MYLNGKGGIWINEVLWVGKRWFYSIKEFLVKKKKIFSVDFLINMINLWVLVWRKRIIIIRVKIFYNGMFLGYIVNWVI